MNSWCEFGFEIECNGWMFLLLISTFLTAIIFTFIIEIKLVNVKRMEAKKKKKEKDQLQELLNKLNDKIIDLANDHSGSEMLQVRKADFYYFKGMILSLQDKEKVDDK